MRIDPKSNVPIFQQIADQLRRKISRGVHRSGEMLPSLRALAVEIQVNPNTVQRAYELLEREGLVESRRGVGIFVSEGNTKLSSEVERGMRRQFTQLIGEQFASGVSPQRLRAIFEDALHEQLRKVEP